MSLYNNIAHSLSRSGLTGAIFNEASSITKGIGDKAASMMGGGELAKAIGTIGGAMARNVVINEVNKHIPIQHQRAINVGGQVIGDIMRGDISQAGLRVLDSGLLNEVLPGMSGVAAQAMYWGRPTPLFGGITPTEAKRIYDEMRGVKLSKKNLFLIEVSSNLMGDMSPWFNMFATDLDYSPHIIAGEKRRVGGSVIDAIQGSEPVDLRITTIDNQSGTIKTWFESHHSAVAAQDGTVGLPGSYAIKFKIVHSFITRDSDMGGYRSIGRFRPANLEVNLSRREDALQEVQMAFSQIDTFVRA